MINFNEPIVTGKEIDNIKSAINLKKISGDGVFTKKCSSWFEKKFNVKKVLFTTSCTHALEMSALLCDIKPGDEVIAPSYTFVSTVNAFVLRGAKIVFVDIRPDTMNIDEDIIEKAITEKTKVILPVHYAGVSCDMDKIMKIAKKYNLYVVEDAAQGMMSKYNNMYLGTIGNLGCYSFHETKNYSMGEGGLLLINDERFIERAEIIREKGTDRSKFFRGEVDKYSWVDIGSSYLPSEINVAYLYPQLEIVDKINFDRVNSWKCYYKNLKELEKQSLIELPFVPDECEINGHIFYIKVKDIQERDRLINYLKINGVLTVFHYIPLHSSKIGKKYGRFYGEDNYTTKESERILRLPMYYGLKEKEIIYITSKITEFFAKKNGEK
ncbi:Lipopolysaccharide biosynthesis protein RffA [Clostridium bornimense]|uniref:Lipopolysaccharide biosynthesis protein RffA n=1 Tax=Clostridium bornimense TaxID=1216932 RepID=W6RXA3_9CLOT|nr:dTDP-4-amino-4,6-dideoxygalactose transaminase [Clostridium bornimense]CDM68259.1 Lipopolysaccharide biosynthesis protein RffA [Clostridium bornimense]